MTDDPTARARETLARLADKSIDGRLQEAAERQPLDYALLSPPQAAKEACRAWDIVESALGPAPPSEAPAQPPQERKMKLDTHPAPHPRYVDLKILNFFAKEICVALGIPERDGAATELDKFAQRLGAITGKAEWQKNAFEDRFAKLEERIAELESSGAPENEAEVVDARGLFRIRDVS